MPETTVVLDAGHGGTDPGATYKGRQEKDDALRLTKAVGRILQNNGINVIYTRSSDIYETPFQKATKANNANADFFVSIHRNSSERDNQYEGVETLVYNDDGIKAVMARNINTELEKVGFKNLGVDERPNLVVLKRTKMPAVLVEVGFINNDKDNELFDTHFQHIAQAIADGILKSLPSRSVATSSTFVDNISPTYDTPNINNTNNFENINNQNNVDSIDTMNNINDIDNDNEIANTDSMNNNNMDNIEPKENMDNPDGYYNRNYNANYDRNYDRNYNTNYDNNYDRNYNPNYNNDYNSNYNNEYPNDYNNRYITDYNNTSDNNYNSPMQDNSYNMNYPNYNTPDIYDDNTYNEPPEKLYRVQTGAFRSKDNADRMLNSLLIEGFPAFIVYDNGIYKVQVGAFRNLFNAIKMEQRLRRFRYNTYISYD